MRKLPATLIACALPADISVNIVDVNIETIAKMTMAPIDIPSRPSTDFWAGCFASFMYDPSCDIIQVKR
jgi:hypothetical protein